MTDFLALPFGGEGESAFVEGIMALCQPGVCCSCYYCLDIYVSENKWILKSGESMADIVSCLTQVTPIQTPL